MLISIDPKALEHACQCAGRAVHHFDRMALDLPLRASIIAHARAIEQNEAFKREVSNEMLEYSKWCKSVGSQFPLLLERFIIAKPDPLVEAIREMALTDATPEDADRLRAALAARGLTITETKE